MIYKSRQAKLAKIRRNFNIMYRRYVYLKSFLCAITPWGLLEDGRLHFGYIENAPRAARSLVRQRIRSCCLIYHALVAIIGSFDLKSL